jgi:Ni,Fe-hydrogenase I large subunit
MGKRIIIDPLTRIEGHLKIEVEIENGVVKDAWSAGTMFRGWEIILRNRDPRDAPYIASRVCGVCEGVHAIASAQALDQAFGIEIPEAGRLMRNLFCAGLYLHDPYIHFYVLSALDYLDIMAVADYKGSDPGLLAVKNKIVSLVQKKDTSPFTPRYNPDEFSVKDPETVLTLVSHYIKALEMKGKSQQMLSILTGLQPHPNSVVVGGCTATPSRDQLLEFRQLWVEQVQFVNEIYAKDVLAVGTGPLFPLAKAGLGRAHGNYMCYPMFSQNSPNGPADYAFGGSNHLIKGGIIIGGENNPVRPVNFDKITEEVGNSWYKYPGGVVGLHPSQGVSDPDIHKEGAYSFIKAPRYDGLPVEVGPLARGLINQYPTLMNVINLGGQAGAVARHLCRSLDAKMVGSAGLAWIDRLIDIATAGPIIGVTEKSVPRTGSGMGVWDAPRGALGHWVEIKNGRIQNYQLVVPSTWNASPRDAQGVRGPYEQALIGAPVPDPDNPINIVRIIRSFDPCLACAIHLIDPITNDIKIYKVS